MLGGKGLASYSKWHPYDLGEFPLLYTLVTTDLCKWLITLPPLEHGHLILHLTVILSNYYQFLIQIIYFCDLEVGKGSYMIKDMLKLKGASGKKQSSIDSS